VIHPGPSGTVFELRKRSSMPGQRTAKASTRRRIWWPIRDAIRTARRLSGSVPARSQHWTAGVSQWFGRLMWTPSTWCL